MYLRGSRSRRGILATSPCSCSSKRLDSLGRARHAHLSLDYRIPPWQVFKAAGYWEERTLLLRGAALPFLQYPSPINGSFSLREVAILLEESYCPLSLVFLFFPFFLI